jgi:hypothetical protein
VGEIPHLSAKQLEVINDVMAEARREYRKVWDLDMGPNPDVARLLHCDPPKTYRRGLAALTDHPDKAGARDFVRAVLLVREDIRVYGVEVL